MLRVIQEIKPTWVLGENVAGIVSMALEQVLSDLERQGYEVQAFIIPAAGVGALHRRKRVFILGHTEHNGQSAEPELRSNETASYKWWQEEQTQTGEFAGASGPADVSSIQRSESRSKWDDVAVPCGERETERGNEGFQQTASLKGTGANNRRGAQEYVGGEWRPVKSGLGMLADGLSYWLGEYLRVEPDIPRVATGVKNRVDQLKCYGNAVVPQQAYPIFKAIAESLQEESK